MTIRLFTAGLYGLAIFDLSSAANIPNQKTFCPVISVDAASNCQPPPSSFLNISRTPSTSKKEDVKFLEDAFSALAVLQNEYFRASNKTWPSSIDWTGAVVETVVSGMLTTLTKSLGSVVSDSSDGWAAKENLISSFYDQIISYYFGQDAEAIKGQAFDDVLWVVLGWIEAVNFVRVHRELHYPGTLTPQQGFPLDMKTAIGSIPWHGEFWVPYFSSRASEFWNFGITGWDTKLCHGGMVWNPRLPIYKNAITNELYISASISMYQYFPGDPFKSGNNSQYVKNPAHLEASIQGYKWLANVNMTNNQGLYVDGFHISDSKPGNVECDLRDEMVYTYNQGVVLTGLRGLWTVSGSPSYLDDGHKLIQAVIKATGWDLLKDAPADGPNRIGELPPWKGIGRGGILEEKCDASGTCSQDGQTFKGIFFHHLTAFCVPLDPLEPVNKVAVDQKAYTQVKTAHSTACGVYLGWVKHNAQAALKTRDRKGRFGMWWGAGVFGNLVLSKSQDRINHNAANTTDYRNEGTPVDDVWGRTQWLPGGQQGRVSKRAADPNDRGRGRTVETQIGGLALLRAYWEMSQSQS